jgi:hypothetical protein
MDNEAKMAGILNIVQTMTTGDDGTESIVQGAAEAGDSEF